SSQLETLTAERNELRSRLENAESRLRISAQEKLAITRSYEQLRARLAARRQKLSSSGETTPRPSSATISEDDVSEGYRQVEEPVPPAPRAYAPQQAAEKDVIRRRSGHH
ncbi:hypothetical protein OSTOST_14655, partial [Ostertagia ostertagi]